jgi:hypothetical protein
VTNIQYWAGNSLCKIRIHKGDYTMAISGPIGLVITLAIAYLASFVFLGLSGFGVWLMFAAVVLLFKGFSNFMNMLKVPGKKTAKTAGILVMVYVVLAYGVFGFPVILPQLEALAGAGISAAFLATPATAADVAAQLTACQASVTAEERDDAASVTINSFDLAAAAGYGTAIDLTTNCRFYKNGNQGENFVTASTDTSDASETAVWSIGDTAYIYCGGTSYYSEPVEGVCIDAKTYPLIIKSYGITTAATGVDIAMFDKNHNALTAAGNTSTADYDITLGANGEERVYVEITQNVARKAYNVGAVATAVFNDIDSFEPIAGQGLTQVVEPNFLKNIGVASDGSGGTAGDNRTLTYDVWMLGTPDKPEPVLLLQWQDIEFGLTVKAGGTDPTATDNVWSTLDGAIVCILDSTYTQGSDGEQYLDIHDHVTDSEADVGFVNLIRYPVGGYDCAVVEGN